MKRHLVATLILSVLLPLGASAQWYLFPGGRASQDSTAVSAIQDDFVPIRSDEEILEEMNSIWTRKVALILPLKSKETPNSNFLDFYCGVLMAADGLSSDKVRYDITVYDSTVEMPNSAELRASDLIIGPVSYDDVVRVLPLARGNYIISPLDPKVASLSDRYNVIQAPSGWDAQASELVRWLAEDLRGGDSVVLLQSPEDGGSEYATRLAFELGDAGIKYEINSTPGAYDGTVAGTCRFVLASENDAFCTSCVREIALMNLRGGHNAVYSTSKLRSIGDLETESIHAAYAHITASYYADPQNPEVKRFSDNYRSIFKGDPGQWVYQGYDLMNYFGTTLGREQSEWAHELSSTPANGLQTDFRFDGTGKINTAVRRLVYNSNNTITALR
ncbi:MAG: ABC transporter substrate-binding protein [Bacteroidales bacterium]|nr:ABC transporter substrate-binding protein [Bacteroidales bacterium]